MRFTYCSILSVVALSGALLTTAAAFAAPIKIDMTPGLWEHRIKMAGDSDAQLRAEQAEQIREGMEAMKAQLANMPPEQRKMMEDMMAKQGVTLSDEGLSIQNDKIRIADGETIVKQCVTQADIDRGYLPREKDSCQPKTTQISRTKIQVVYDCVGENPAKGEGEFEMISPKKYKGKSHFITSIQGQPQTVDTEHSGTWLSSDCGDIKPEEQ